MQSPEVPAQAERFGPHAGSAMAEMFDDVSGRYELINGILSLGRVGAWRQALASAIPDQARVVLDLCTGNGASLQGLRRPGRLVIGADVSLGMLESAAALARPGGWAPQLVCADAFRLPLRSGSLDAVTIAFGMRNLRPRGEALAELARVLRPGGVLAVLEAAAPRRGSFTAPLHDFYLRRIVPLAGRLSKDPSAYGYLARSILDFGSGAEFEADLGSAGFSLEERRGFLMGATRLWSARRRPEADQIASNSPAGLHSARASFGETAGVGQLAREWRAWTLVQALISAALVVTLAVGGWAFFKSGAGLPLEGWQRALAWSLLGAGLAGFMLRTWTLIVRLGAGRPRL